MSTPRRLSPEELARAVQWVEGGDPDYLDAIQGHITALEAEIATLRTNDRAALEQLAHALGWKDGGPGWQAAIDEIAAVTAKLDKWRVAPGPLLDRVCEARNGPHDISSESEAIPVSSDLVQGLMARALPAMEETAASWKARAEAAEAKLARLTPSGQVAEEREVIAQALRSYRGHWKIIPKRAHAEMDAADAALSRLAAQGQGYEAMKAERDATVAEHAKALVRARNDGLEMAARAAGPDRGLAERLRAMKERES